MILIWIFGALAMSYLLGSIPFGLLLTRAAGLGDIRSVGSGNIGATNVMRTGRKSLGIMTLLLDAGKGALAVWLTRIIYTGADLTQIAALAAVLGHIFPLWLRFRGGKGVATAVGALFALNWLLGLIVCAVWLLVFQLSRYASLASIVAMGVSAVAAYPFDDFLTALLCLSLASLITFTHRGNILRLMRGTEARFKSKRTA